MIRARPRFVRQQGARRKSSRVRACTLYSRLHIREAYRSTYIHIADGKRVSLATCARTSSRMSADVQVTRRSPTKGRRPAKMFLSRANRPKITTPMQLPEIKVLSSPSRPRSSTVPSDPLRLCPTHAASRHGQSRGEEGEGRKEGEKKKGKGRGEEGYPPTILAVCRPRALAPVYVSRSRCLNGLVSSGISLLVPLSLSLSLPPPPSPPSSLLRHLSRPSRIPVSHPPSHRCPDFSEVLRSASVVRSFPPHPRADLSSLSRTLSCTQ